MRTIVITGVFSIIIGLGAGWLIFHPAGRSSLSTERKILYYRDPMNPKITSPTPKKSSDGMEFVPVYDESTGSIGEKKIAYYKDPMHPWYTSEKPGKAPDCGMDLVPVYEGESDVKGIKIDPVTVQNIGVKVETAEKKKLKKVIRTVGKVDFDETKVFSVNTKIMGWVEKLYVDYTGKSVRKGDTLMELYSPELVSTQQEYLQALNYRKQLQQSTIEEARKGAEALVESAKRRLLNWDISDVEIQELEQRGAPKKTMTILSPADGIVMEKMVFKGMNAMAGMELYKIADLSTVWIIADIYQFELPWMEVGQQAKIELSYLSGKTFRGIVTYVYPTVNMETKTVKVRIEIKNTSKLDFKPEMFATVRLESPVMVNAVAIPDQAIIRSGERNIVVVSLGGGYFDPREVKLGMTADGYVQILQGISEGEKIVTSSQFLIDSESNLKAAVSQMLGHAGHDMSKPMEDQKAGPEEPKGDEMQKPAKAKEKGASKQPRGHEMKDDRSETKDQNSSEKNLSATPKVIDPVCRMETTPDKDRSTTFKGTTYYFCSDGDMEKFKKNPEKYASSTDKQ
jgi:RND family efflux transporter MFP subunit